jgi:UDPglucose 6-dehydrogenase
MKLAIIGCGYVGLVTGVCFAELGFNVAFVDSDGGKIDRLNRGECPIYEPSLEELIAKNRDVISFFTDASVVGNADIIFIAVGTPSNADGSCNISHVLSATRVIAPHLHTETVVVIKSTVPPGTCAAVEREIHQINHGARFSVVSNPEFLREGCAIDDFMHPDRIVIGSDAPWAEERMHHLYRFIDASILCTTRESSELIKYSANTFLAMKVAFINEIAQISDKLGAISEDVVNGIGMDKRIGHQFLKPGPGFGGSCFPKDVAALRHLAKTPLISQILPSNEARKRYVTQKILDTGAQKIAILGLTFKAHTDDLRDSPAMDIALACIEAGREVVAYDPQGKTDKVPMDSLENCLQSSQLAVILTEWPEFADIEHQCILDFRGILGSVQHPKGLQFGKDAVPAPAAQYA